MAGLSVWGHRCHDGAASEGAARVLSAAVPPGRSFGLPPTMPPRDEDDWRARGPSAPLTPPAPSESHPPMSTPGVQGWPCSSCTLGSVDSSASLQQESLATNRMCSA